jgi:hypothetical protein
MKLKLIPKSDIKLESNLKWRLFKVIYFMLGIISAVIYSLNNSWYYTTCPITDLPWSEEKLLCTKFFAWEELLIVIIIAMLIFRILFPLIERLVLYIISGQKD